MVFVKRIFTVLIIVLCCSGTVHAAEDTDEVNSDQLIIVDHAADGRALYSDLSRPKFAVINSIVGEGYDAEKYFLNVIDSDHKVIRGDTDQILELQPNMEYEIQIYYCAGGKAAVGTKVITQDTRAILEMPESVNGDATLIAKLAAENTTPSEVQCQLPLHSTTPLRLSYVKSTAKIVNSTATNGSFVDPQELFSAEGARIGTNSMTGIVVPGEENAGYVTLRIQTSAETTESATATTAQETLTTASERRFGWQDSVLILCLLVTIAVVIGYFASKKKEL